MAFETRGQQRDRLLRTLNNLPNDFHAKEIDELKAMINDEAARGGSLDEAERRVGAATITWGKAGLGFYDGVITSAERQRKEALITIKKYDSLVELLRTAEKAYTESQEGTISEYEKELRGLRTDSRVGESTHDTMVKTSLVTAQADMVDAQRLRAEAEARLKAEKQKLIDANATYMQEAEDRHYLKPEYVERYKASLAKFSLFGLTRGKFDKLPSSEQAKQVKSFMLKQPADTFVAFNAVDSNGNGPAVEAQAAFEKHVAIIQEKIDQYERELAEAAGLATTRQGERDEVVRAVEKKETDLIALTEDIEKLSGKIARYNDFVKLNFEERQAIISDASQAFGADFASKLQSGDIHATIEFNRSSRLFYAKQDLAALRTRYADHATLTTDEYLAKHGETYDQTAMSISALQGYITTLEGQPKFLRRIEGKVSTVATDLRSVLARDMNRDSFDYLERAFAHYYHQTFYNLPNNDTKKLDADIRNLFTGEIGHIEDRIRHERARAIAARDNFKYFVAKELDPVASVPGTVDISEEITKKLGMLAARRESVLTAVEGQTTKVVNGKLTTYPVVSVDKTVTRDIDYAMSDPTVARYTALTMMREELLAKGDLNPTEQAKLAEVSAQLKITITEATKKGLLTDLIEANKVAAETLMPGYDRLKAFAAARGLDLSNPKHREILRSPEMQVEFDRIFVESVRERQPEDLLLEIQTFIAANEEMAEKIKITIVDGKPYLNFREYVIEHKQGDPMLDKDGKPLYDDPKPLLDANGNPILDDKGNPRMRLPEPRLYTENVYKLDDKGNRIEVEGSQNGVLLTDAMLQNPELLAAFGFEMKEGMVVAKKVPEPESFSITDILDKREQLVKDPSPNALSIPLYGNASAYVDISELEAMMDRELSEAYVRYTSGKTKSYYAEAVAITKKYMQAIYDSKPVEARVETPREEAPADPPPVVEPPKPTTMTSEAAFRTEKRTRQGKELNATKKKLEEKFLGKKVVNEETKQETREGGFLQAIDKFDKSEKSPEAQAMLDQAVAMAFGATLEYINTYNLSPDVIAALNEQLKAQGITITPIPALAEDGETPLLDENNNPIYNGNSIVRETEGSIQTFTLGQDGKVNVVEQPKVQAEEQGGGQ